MYHLWIYARFVSNVNVNDFSLVPQTLLNVVYLQQRKIEVSLLIGDINGVFEKTASCFRLEEGREFPHLLMKCVFFFYLL